MKSSNIMHSKSNATTSKNSKTGTYGAPTAPSATAEYRNDFRSGEANPSYTPNSTNTAINANYVKAGKDIFEVKDANDVKSKAATAARAFSAYSNTCQSGDIDSSLTYSTNGLINTSRNGTSKANGIDNSKNGKQSHYHESAAPPASAAYPSAFQSGQQVPSAFAPSNDTIHSKTYTKDTSSISKIKKGNIGNYHSSTTHPAAGSYSSALDPDYVDSTYAESTDAMYNTNTNSTSKNCKNVNNQSATTRPATATYSRASQSREIDSRSIPSSSHTTNDANAASVVDIGNPMNYGKKNNYQSTTSRPTIVANSRALKPSDVHTNSGSSAQAWEEHIDVATNRSFYYNNITKRVSRVNNSEPIQVSTFDEPKTKRPFPSFLRAFTSYQPTWFVDIHKNNLAAERLARCRALLKQLCSVSSGRRLLHDVLLHSHLFLQVERRGSQTLFLSIHINVGCRLTFVRDGEKWLATHSKFAVMVRQVFTSHLELRESMMKQEDIHVFSVSVL